MTRARWASLALAAALVTAPMATAEATPSADPGRTCLPGGGEARSTRAADSGHYTLRQLRLIDRRLKQRLAARSATTSSRARAGLVLRIPVHVHVIDGDHARGPSRARVVRQLKVLDGAYAGAQSAANTPTRFRFYLDTFDRTRNETWRSASMSSAADRRMRRTLHLGGPDELNLYFSAPVSSSAYGVVLGWSSVPWRAARRPLLDGVTIHQGSMPGGSLRGYNRGDTTVHEVGHWLGLFHTFEGGCSLRNDRVDDTPAEASPSSGCVRGRDTCDAPGLDPIHNFMDYSFDSCMNRFTPGQVSRMTDNWLAYRTP